MKFAGNQIAKIGFFTKSHGNSGELEFSPLDNIKQIIENEWVFVDIQQELIPFYIQKILQKNKKLIVKIKNIDNIDSANNLSKKYVYSHNLSNVDKGSDDLSIEDCIGYFVYDLTSNKDLGTITNIYDEQANPLIEIIGEKEILVPINGNFINKIIHQEKKVVLKLPINYIDI